MSASESAATPQPGETCYEARAAGCTCAWLRGFGVGPVAEEWAGRIISVDEDCPVRHEESEK